MPSAPPTPPSPTPVPTTSAPLASKNGKSSRSPFSEPTPYQLRSLVMDYLCHHCYTRTAVAFAKDGTVRHLDADGDEILQPKDKGILADQDILELSKETLREAELRNKIRVKILSGQVDDAIDLLNEHFPSVLAPPTPGSRSSSSSYPSALEAMNSSKHLIPTTTDPRHLLLNLRILGFTELCRTQPLVYSSPSLRTSELDMSESATSSGAVNVEADRSPSYKYSQGTGSDADEDIDMDTTEDEDVEGSGEAEEKDFDRTPPHDATGNGNDTGDDPHVVGMIQQGQKLYTLLEQIHNPAEKELYAQELINVGALLAYPHPESSPLARYLSMERREAVAEQINKAILVWTGQSPTSKIEVVTRYTTVLWALANELKVKARHGAVVPPVNSAQRTPTPPMQTKQVPESDQRQIVPPFSLQTLLDLR